MALFDRFKKEKTDTAKPAAKAPASEKSPSVIPALARSSKDRDAIGFRMLLRLTEKTTHASEGGWYTFRIPNAVNKIMVRRAVEQRYSVHVEQVHTTPVKPRAMSLGRIKGTVPGFKKAMVKLRTGETIQFS